MHKVEHIGFLNSELPSLSLAKEIQAFSLLDAEKALSGLLYEFARAVLLRACDALYLCHGGIGETRNGPFAGCHPSILHRFRPKSARFRRALTEMAASLTVNHFCLRVGVCKEEFGSAEGRTADPSAALGMTKVAVALSAEIGLWMRDLLFWCMA
jgi:hypothetical protein